MNTLDFLKKYLPDARNAESITHINYLVSLAQAALESGWGEHAPMNNFFGIKDTDGVNRQLLPTTEVNRSSTKNAQQVGLSFIDRVEQKIDSEGKPYFVYYGKAWFETFATPKDAFVAHGKLFFNKWGNGQYVYKDAIQHLSEPEIFVDLIAPIYASGVGYANTVKSIMKTISDTIKKYSL